MLQDNTNVYKWFNHVFDVIFLLNIMNLICYLIIFSLELTNTVNNIKMVLQ